MRRKRFKRKVDEKVKGHLYEFLGRPVDSINDLFIEDIIFCRLYAAGLTCEKSFVKAYKNTIKNNNRDWIKNRAIGLTQYHPVFKNLIKELREDFEPIELIDEKIEIAGMKSREERIKKLEELAQKAEDEGNYVGSAKIYETIIKMEGHFAPREINVNKKSVELSFGGWNPSQGVQQIEEKVEPLPLLQDSTQFEILPDISQENINDERESEQRQ